MGGAAPQEAVANDLKKACELFGSNVRRDATFRLEPVEQADEALFDVLVASQENVAHGLIAHRLGTDFDHHGELLMRRLDEVVLSHVVELAHHVTQLTLCGNRFETITEFGAVALADTGAERLLRVEIRVE